jgi:hypothetical protein
LPICRRRDAGNVPKETTMPKTRTHPEATDPREALKESERKASQDHPENFKDDATEEKIVEVAPVEEDGSAIRGLDPKR